MIQNFVCSAGLAPLIADVHVVALYEPSDGRIVHLHAVVVCEGGRPISEQDAIDEARSHAAKRNRRPERLMVSVSKDISHASRPHRIDVRSGAFLPVTSIRALRNG